MKFYPADWRADPALRMCSIGARGLWMEMLCLMHEAEPRGSLLINGMQVTGKQLAALAGVSIRDVAGFLGELCGAGVYSKQDNGVIFSRRMRRDEDRAERDKANGSIGGNPSLKRGVNPPDNGVDKAQKLEARVQSPERQKEGAPARTDRYSQEFDDQVWKPYPRTPVMSKAEAWKAWQKSTDADRAKIVAAVPKYTAWLQSKPDHPAVHACRFISQRRFDGFGEPFEQQETSHGVQKTGSVVAAADRLVERIAGFNAKPPSGELAGT